MCSDLDRNSPFLADIGGGQRIIDTFEIHVVNENHLSVNQVLMKLDVNDMRNMALKLMEYGFKIKEINALDFKEGGKNITA